MKALITGSSGLVGSEAVRFLCAKGWEVYGIDNDTRGYLFGENASTVAVGKKLSEKYNKFKLFNQIDIRNYKQLKTFFKKSGPFDFIIHTAAQPSHEWSTDHALEDFAINATGTVNMLEIYRQFSSKAVFIYVSSSKVYGDSVNKLPLVEFETRYDLHPSNIHYPGMEEKYMRLDGNLHSLFGVSKACGDIMAQEYGKYFDLPIGIFRPVCITGSVHKGAKLHGYLAYLVKCIATGKKYVINGYKGKQVRDNMHAFDLVSAFWEFYQNPKNGEVYNIGAGRISNNSILEAIAQAEKLLNKKANIEYSEVNRRGDHKFCIYSAKKFRKDYPNWGITYDNDKIMNELCNIYL